MDAHERHPQEPPSHGTIEGAGPPASPGAPAGPPTGAAPSAAALPPWEAVVPVWRSAVVIRQLSAVLIIAVVLAWLFVVVLQAVEGDLDAATFWAVSKVFLIILAVLLALAGLTLLFLFRRYEYSFAIDAQGIVAATTGATAKRNRVINLLLILSGRPTAMGAGTLAASRQRERLRWQDVDTFKVDPQRRQIRLIRKRRTVMLVQCTEENFAAVATFIGQRVPDRS